MSGAGALSLTLPRGLTADRAERMADLVARATAMPDARDDLPWLAPALLFAEPAVRRQLAMPATGTGEALVQDYQAIRYAGRFPVGCALDAAASQTQRDTSAEFRFQLSTPGAAPCADLTTSLRVVPGDEIARAAPAELRAEALKGAVCGAEMAVPQSLVDSYLTLSGDPNPIHSDRAIARAMRLSAPVVPGLMLISLIQPFCARSAPGAALTELKARFLAPVCVGSTFQVCVQHRGTGPQPGTARLRAYLLAADRRAVAIADLSLTDPAPA